MEFGSFSNLGDWDPEKNHPGRMSRKMVFLPAGLTLPADRCGLCNLSKSIEPDIHAHPELITESKVCKDWMLNWVKEIELDLASGLTDPVNFPWERTKFKT